MQDKRNRMSQGVQQLSKQELEHILGGTFAGPGTRFDGIDGESDDKDYRPTAGVLDKATPVLL